MIITNISHETIFAMVYGDKENTLNRTIGFSVDVNGMGIGFNANKESSWEWPDLYGFTKIVEGTQIKLSPIADKHTVYLTVRTTTSYICVAAPFSANTNVIITSIDGELIVQNAKKKSPWELVDNKKPESKGKTDDFLQLQEENKAYKKENAYLKKQLKESSNNRNDQKTREQENNNANDRSSQSTRRISLELAKLYRIEN